MASSSGSSSADGPAATRSSEWNVSMACPDVQRRSEIFKKIKKDSATLPGHVETVSAVEDYVTQVEMKAKVSLVAAIIVVVVVVAAVVV